jgi:hypothetical protein
MNRKEKAVASGFSGCLLLFLEPRASSLIVYIFPLKKLTRGETVDVFVYMQPAFDGTNLLSCQLRWNH